MLALALFTEAAPVLEEERRAAAGFLGGASIRALSGL
jgi:hypothetical protein